MGCTVSSETQIEYSLKSKQGIHGSTILKDETYKDSLNQELKKFGKNGAAELLYKASRDGFS